MSGRQAVNWNERKVRKVLRLKLELQHRLNPLHIYCRLIPILGKQMAMAFCSKYELVYARVL